MIFIKQPIKQLSLIGRKYKGGISMGIIFSVFIILVVIFVLYRILSGKGTPDNSYTPFDYITGQTDTEFHENERESEPDDQS